MDNFTNYGLTFSYQAAGAVLPNQIISQSNITGIAINSLTAAEYADVTIPDAKKVIVVALEGRYTVATKAGDSFAIGALAYIDGANNRVTSTVGGNKILGTCVTAVTGSGVAQTVDVIINRKFGV